MKAVDILAMKETRMRQNQAAAEAAGGLLSGPATWKNLV
jgi:hypothetical protein